MKQLLLFVRMLWYSNSLFIGQISLLIKIYIVCYYILLLYQGDVGQDVGNKLEVTGTEDVVTLMVNKRESKSSVQMKSHVLNTFGSSFEDAHKLQRKTIKTVIFSLKAYPFRMDIDIGSTDEAQKMFYDFLFDGIKHRNK